MVRVKSCAVLILYCIFHLLNVSLAATQKSWRADHDTHKLPDIVKHQQSQHQVQQQQVHQVQQPQIHQLQQQQRSPPIDNVYYVDGESSNAVNVPADKRDGANVQSRDYFPANRIEIPRLLEQSDKRFDDGHYEYSYTLSNGDTRYERAYWLPSGSEIILARKGYYSYPMPDNKYYTVFYTSDQNGFQQDSSAYSSGQPTLPRTVNVPEHPVSQNQHGVIQHINIVPAKPAAVNGIPHNNNNFVTSQGVGHWKSQDPYDSNASYNKNGEFKRVRRHINEEKVEETVDKTQSKHATQGHQVQVPHTTETSVVESKRVQYATPQPTVEVPRIEDIATNAQAQVPVYPQQQPNRQVYTDLRDPIYNVQNYQNTVPQLVQRQQQFPASLTYPIPNQINTLNRQTIPVGSPTELNTFNTLNGPILGNRQTQIQQPFTQLQQPLTLEQQQQIVNQNALLNYLLNSRLSSESPESYSSESNDHYLPGLLGANNQLAALLGGNLGTEGGPANQFPTTSGVGGQTRRRIRGNTPVWPLQQQQTAQRFY